MVEKRWRAAWEAEEGDGEGDRRGTGAAPLLFPADHEVTAAFAERRRRFSLSFSWSLS